MNNDKKPLSPILNYALRILKNSIDDIMNGDCNEEEVANIVARLHPESNGYIDPHDYCNADQALKLLGIGYNRNKLFELTKKYGIQNHKVNNMNIGFKRSEIMLLRQKIDNGEVINKRPRKRKGQTKWLEE